MMKKQKLAALLDDIKNIEKSLTYEDKCNILQALNMSFDGTLNCALPFFLNPYQDGQITINPKRAELMGHFVSRHMPAEIGSILKHADVEIDILLDALSHQIKKECA